ncbi:MAG: hypothetical protein OEZ06_20350 [Myxococcales bacterium]|nr:hypothetical protein [Myxococcales bacterium]
MNLKILIDGVVRQTTVLIAQLATAGGVRAPLSHVANQVFVDLSRELEAQGVSRKVSADMFGMALRTYLRRVQWLSEDTAERDQSLWEAVLEYLGQGGLLARGRIFERFADHDPDLVRGVLHDLTESGLAFASGKGDSRVYRATTEAERVQMRAAGGDGGFDELVWTLVYREGPLARARLIAASGNDAARVDQALTRLLARGHVVCEGDRDRGSYSASALEIRLGSEIGWEAAVLDHYQALVKTICQRLLGGSASAEGRVGGSTFTFDVWPGHPLADEVYACLQRFREAHVDLYERVEAYNAEHGLPEQLDRVLVYGGQCLLDHPPTGDEMAEEVSK